MTRIVAGQARGRRLRVPPGRGTRPTSDRVREALFSTVTSLLGGLDGRRVLDLYAGSGALGLEALSRGAGHVRLVESDRRAASAIDANIEAVGLPGAQLTVAAVERVVAGPADQRYDLVLADPPYAVGVAELTRVLRALTRGWLAEDAVIVVERDRRGEVEWPAGIVAGLPERRYGETVLWYGRSAGS